MLTIFASAHDRLNLQANGIPFKAGIIKRNPLILNVFIAGLILNKGIGNLSEIMGNLLVSLKKVVKGAMPKMYYLLLHCIRKMQ